LTEDDRVIVTGLMRVRPGMTVTPVEQAPPPGASGGAPAGGAPSATSQPPKTP